MSMGAGLEWVPHFEILVEANLRQVDLYAALGSTFD